MWVNRWNPFLHGNSIFPRSDSSTSTFQLHVLVWRVERTLALSRKSKHLSILGIGYESRFAIALNLLQLTQKHSVPYHLGSETIGTAHSVFAGSITFWASNLSTSILLDFLFLRSARWEAKLSGLFVSSKSSIGSFATFIRPGYPSLMTWNPASLSMKSFFINGVFAKDLDSISPVMLLLVGVTLLDWFVAQYRIMKRELHLRFSIFRLFLFSSGYIVRNKC